jgi:hypothetical protein
VAGLLHTSSVMRDYSDADFSDEAVRREFLADLDEIERRAATLDRETRHDVTNAAGAARNALLLVRDGTTTLPFARLVDIVRRNSRNAAELLEARSDASARGNERNDLGGSRQGNDADAFGL